MQLLLLILVDQARVGVMMIALISAEFHLFLKLGVHLDLRDQLSLPYRVLDQHRIRLLLACRVHVNGLLAASGVLRLLIVLGLLLGPV